MDKDLIRQQTEKTRRLLHEKETINKEVDFDQDKLCSKLLSLVSRENRYAASVLQLMKIKQQFYEVAFQTINAELPCLEGTLNVFAEFFTVLRYVTSKEIRSKNTKWEAVFHLEWTNYKCQMFHFGDFLENLKHVTRQVNFNWTKIVENTKNKKFKCDILNNFRII